ncbi:hypothetical protein TPHA_0A05560 [Tetrapisispora phaffii CBS 4417]|uniref:Cytidyltransferase-like domain-containing protein n=1 Tax=Tetrapisispora phaffii (strain ATCC 24235 / CBS 4417 / NBRC 1672 / NRRL Y-8282 / UCD 70-5) TaxID=1071381 RepID=G8BP02_TETPH|nr:hypothetical protein TPHA_0A05560 [Tetrapisispora phaffii CBS 4417]CCE61630.1 hypothetical protein TPHA_0A05560 [Tetrapisispora phaffii CBS 4417]
MVKVGIVLEQIDRLDFGLLDNYLNLCLQELMCDINNGELDIILMKRFTSYTYLDNILGTLYTRSRDVLMMLNLPLVPINILLYQQSMPIIGTLHWDVLYVCSEDVKEKMASDKYISYEEPVTSTIQEKIVGENDKTENQYSVSALGGTFDHLHDGHKILLTVASFLTEHRLIVGITDKELLANKSFAEYLEPFETRSHNVTKFLELMNPALSIEVTPLKDVCGPTGRVPELEALIVSRETIKGGEIVNKERVTKGLAPLEICIVNVLGGQEGDNWSEKLSSTTMRKYIASK